MAFDIYAVVTDKIVAALESGTVPWRKPWAAGASGGHVSLATGKGYRGINPLLLSLTAMEKGYTSPLWGSYKQLAALGGQVRKGEKGTLVVFWKRLLVDNPKAGQPGQKAKKVIPMLRHFNVFNVEQADGVVLPPRFAKLVGPQVVRNEKAVIADAEALVAEYLASGPSLSFGGDRAYFSPGQDHIQLPQRDDFDSSENFYTTLYHEITHSTGHASRLARKGLVENHFFGSAEYGYEELVAEFGAAFLSTIAGIAPATIDQSASYLASWIKTIKADPKMVVRAAAAAQKAADLAQGIVYEAADADAGSEVSAAVA